VRTEEKKRKNEIDVRVDGGRTDKGQLEEVAACIGVGKRRRDLGRQLGPEYGQVNLAALVFPEANGQQHC
jgi:hypothetical protein